MNHQPYREWLFSDEQLSTEQADTLQDHLKTCESCQELQSAWTEVETAIDKIPSVKPAPGFTLRWQAHLSMHQARKQKQHGWMMIGATLIIVLGLLGLISTQVWSIVQAPGPYLAALFSNLVNLLSIYHGIQAFITPVSWSMPIYVSIGLIFMVGSISFMSVLWLATYRKFSSARRTI